jgi:hypothetical protein
MSPVHSTRSLVERFGVCLRAWVLKDEFQWLLKSLREPETFPRMIAIASELANKMRETRLSPGYPAELLPFGVVMDRYDGEQMIRRRETVMDGSQEATLEAMMCDPLIRYVMVRDATAGCFDLRVEKDNSRSLRDDKQRKTTADPYGMTNKEKTTADPYG